MRIRNVGFFLAFILAFGSQSKADPPSDAVQITTKVLSTSNLGALLNDPQYVPTTRISIKFAVRNAPATGVIRFSLEGRDEDGYMIKKFTMPDIVCVEGDASTSTRVVEIHTSKLQRIREWAVSDADVVHSATAIVLQDFKTKVVRGSRGEELFVRATCQNLADNEMPRLIVIEGLDKDGFAICTIMLGKSDATRWSVEGNTVRIEQTGLSPDTLDKVREWRAWPNAEGFSTLDQLLDSDHATSD